MKKYCVNHDVLALINLSNDVETDGNEATEFNAFLGVIKSGFGNTSSVKRQNLVVFKSCLKMLR